MARSALLVTFLVIAACGSEPTGPPTAGEPTVRPSAPPLLAPRPTPTDRPVFWVEAPIEGDPSPVFGRIPATGVKLEGQNVRLLAPKIAAGPRRVGIQAGHWRTAEAPSEFRRLRFSFGGSFDGVNEVDVTLDVARIVTDLLRERGIVADLLPAVIPPSYVADAFVALHADSDESATAQGFKIAHGTYRSPYDEQLTGLLIEHYSAASGLRWERRVTDDMTDYYAFAWFRYEHALAPHTPAAIVEMGFISHPRDRAVLLDEQERVARGIVEGIVRFLDSVPRDKLFAEDIVVPIVPAPAATPTATP